MSPACNSNPQEAELGGHCWVCYHLPVIPAHRRLSQEDSVEYGVTCLKSQPIGGWAMRTQLGIMSPASNPGPQEAGPGRFIVKDKRGPYPEVWGYLGLLETLSHNKHTSTHKHHNCLMKQPSEHRRELCSPGSLLELVKLNLKFQNAFCCFLNLLTGEHFWWPLTISKIRVEWIPSTSYYYSSKTYLFPFKLWKQQ